MKECNVCQEKLARGASLGDAEARHLEGCAACTSVATAYSLVDGALESLAYDVPSGFAERVMSRVAQHENRGARRRAWDERWAFLLAPAALIFATVNVVEFLTSVVSHSVGLGGAP
jgi:hypothetical protein